MPDKPAHVVSFHIFSNSKRFLSFPFILRPSKFSHIGSEMYFYLERDCHFNTNRGPLYGCLSTRMHSLIPRPSLYLQNESNCSILRIIVDSNIRGNVTSSAYECINLSIFTVLFMIDDNSSSMLLLFLVKPTLDDLWQHCFDRSCYLWLDVFDL